MKICHVITRLVAGGAQKNTLICALHQQRAGHQVTVISGTETSSEGSLLEVARAGPYRWQQLPSLVREARPHKDLAALLALIRIFRRERFDLVHTHTSKGGILGRVAAALCRVPVVVHTPHGHVFHSYFSDFKAKIFEVLERWAAPLADCLVMLSGAELADHHKARVSLPQRMVVIPSGVQLAGFRELECGGGPFTVGYVGRLADIKGPLDLVNGFAAHALRQPDTRLLLVGDGPQRDEVEELVRRHGLQERVEITGWQEDIRAYLVRMNLLVVPSHNEGMGRVVVEAMAAGLPVVATRVGGLQELVEENASGVFVPPGDPAAIGQVLDQLAQDPDQLKQMGARGKARAHLYSEEVMLQRLDQLYARLAMQKGINPA